MKRRLFILAAALSLLMLISVAVLWVRSRLQTTDVCMIPIGQHQQLMFTSHSGGWFEITLLKRWPDSRFGWWSGPGWRNVGPFKFWQTFRSSRNGVVQILEGQMAFPLASPGGPPCYEGSYDRAVAFGYPERAVGGSPEWGRIMAREIKLPYTPLLLISALPCILVLLIFLVFLRVRRRRRLRSLAGLCIHCGYDLRASPGKCPECGAVSTSEARAKAVT